MGLSSGATRVYVVVVAVQLAAVLLRSPWFEASAQVPLAVWLALVLLLGWFSRKIAGALSLLTAAAVSYDDHAHCPCAGAVGSGAYALLWVGHASTLFALAAWGAEPIPHPRRDADALPRARATRRAARGRTARRAARSTPGRAT